MKSAAVLLRSIMQTSMILILVLAPQALLGQHTSGSVNGTVVDIQGRVIVGAAVTLTNQDTNVISRVTTGGNGGFVLLNIAPGPYIATITKQGFSTVETPVFNLTVDQALTLNQTLPIGIATETVQVSAETMSTLLQKSTSELGTTIQAKEIQQLPLNGRNFTSLLILSPGVTPVSTAQGSGISTTDAGVSATAVKAVSVA
ncbi:MAG: carboxypeptidase regulatory-like domain-containing protein, partial [Acidobacteriales bacterium]|nr:carboxypeptidase regulatory-like domain-containing protein [Terriglobales bacterium]